MFFVKSTTKATIASTLILAGAVSAQSATIFSDDFNYANGNLLGQGTWSLTGSTTTAPIQVVDGKAVLGTTGQDLNASFGEPLILTDGMTMTISATINVASAQANGDYFLHWTPASDSTSFFTRLFAKSSGSGFVFGHMETSGTGSATVYGTQTLSYGTDYQVVLAYNKVAGERNDTAAIYVNPAGELSANTPYLLDSEWTSVTLETNRVGVVNLRQGSSSSAAAVTVDNLKVEIIPVPEPASVALLGLGIAALFAARRRS